MAFVKKFCLKKCDSVEYKLKHTKCNSTTHALHRNIVAYPQVLLAYFPPTPEKIPYESM